MRYSSVPTLPFDQNSIILDYFNDHLPHNPYCTNDPEYGVRIRQKSHAMHYRYIQLNPPHSMGVFAYDLDYPGGAIGWDERGCPPFNISVMSRDTATAHGLYIVSPSIRTAPDGSIAALKYGAALQRGLRVKLGADPNYANLLCKNPNHADWQVTQWRHEPYTLDELADYLDLSACNAPQYDNDYGLGRNCTVFEKTRTWSYRAIRRNWPDYPQWFNACFEKAMGYNADFPVPLSAAEIHHLAKSVATWTHKRFSKEEFSRIQARRGAKGGSIGGNISKGGGRPISSDSIEQLKPWKSIGISRASYFRYKKLGLL